MKKNIKKNKLNPREEIISLLRGFFATPVISGLSKIGIVDKIIDNKLNKIPANYNKKLIEHSLEYLRDLGILKIIKKKYLPTLIGKKILKRQGSFMLLHSYHEYISNYSRALKDTTLNSSCDRFENIIGSSRVHGNKYFKEAINQISKTYKIKIKNYVDLGCGEGKFLSIINNNVSNSNLIGTDYSKISVNNTKSIKNKNKNKIMSFQSDAFDLINIKKNLKNLRISPDDPILFSFCFILHELKFNKKNNIKKYLNKLVKHYPNSKVLICEINNIDSKMISDNKLNTILPEFYFFHKISNQKLFSQKLLKNDINLSKYKIVKELNFDFIDYEKQKIPSIYFYFLDTKF